jgi:hypothetical protein
MRPSRKAAYWETRVSIFLPFQVTVFVSGSSVVSDRKGLPSTWPSSTTEWRSLIGKSGLVIFVGLEKEGWSRSTRSLVGAQPRPL